MKILEGRTVEQAIEYFEQGRTQFSHVDDPKMKEVYALANSWKIKNIPYDQRKDYPINEICISLIRNEL